MLRSSKEIMGYVLLASDGEIGRCKDFLFDDVWWAVRYMTADTRKWLPGRKVLISPINLGTPDWQTRRLPVELSKAQIEQGPPLDADAPVSRQYESRHMEHFGYSPYWVGGGVWGASSDPVLLSKKARDAGGGRDPQPAKATMGQSLLRSVDEVTGYSISATDGELGHVEDMIVDDVNWRIRYVVVDTRNWLPSPKVLLAPDWIEAVHWEKRQVDVALPKQRIREAPQYLPNAPINRAYEERLYDFYGRPRYW